MRCPRSHVLSGVSYSVLFCSTTTSGVAAVGVVSPAAPHMCPPVCTAGPFAGPVPPQTPLPVPLEPPAPARPTRAWSGRIGTVHAAVVSSGWPYHTRRCLVLPRSSNGTEEGSLWRRIPRNIGKTGSCTSPGHALNGTPHTAWRPRCRRPWVGLQMRCGTSRITG